MLLRRRTAALVAVGAVSVVATMLGRVLGVDALVYLPVFLLGTLVAVRLEDIVEWAHRRPRPVLWTVGGTVSPDAVPLVVNVQVVGTSLLPARSFTPSVRTTW